MAFTQEQIERYQTLLRLLIGRLEEDLKDEATGLAQSMINLGMRLENAPKGHASINVLGEVQQQGAKVDRLCGEIGRVRDALDNFNAVERGFVLTGPGRPLAPPVRFMHRDLFPERITPDGSEGTGKTTPGKSPV